MARNDEFDDDHRPRRDDRDDDFDRPRRDRYDDRGGPPPRRKSGGKGIVLILSVVGLLVLVCGGGLFALVFFAVGSVRDAASRMQSSNNLKQIALAHMNYNDANDELASNTYGPDGKPLLSWRVHILPFIEQNNLHKQFKLDEPWNSPNNIKLLDQMPRVYARPQDRNSPPGRVTYYRGFSSPGAAFEKRPDLAMVKPKGGPIRDPGLILRAERFNLRSFKDGVSDTILVVEAGDPVEWTKPDDLDASPGKPFPKMGGLQWRSNVFNVVMADGTVRPLKLTTPESTLRALVTHSGGETVPIDLDQ
jgi:Protein of unknown function (DUF1559)